jgi:hypothetical protein
MPRQFAARDVNAASGAVTLALYDEEKCRKTISNQHRTALRTAEALRRLVLFAPENDVIGKSEVTDFKAGQVDPQVILALKARDAFLTEANDNVRLGYFREMRSLYQSAKEDCVELVKSMTQVLERQAERDQAERHHQDKMAILKEKGNKDHSGSTLRTLMDRAMEGQIEERVEAAIDRLAPIVIEEDHQDDTSEEHSTGGPGA